jgi:hypothetical protein
MRRLEEQPWLLEWAGRWPGQVIMFGLFGWIFRDIYIVSQPLGRAGWLPIVLASLLCALAGAYRRQVLAVTTLVLLLLAPDWYPSVWLTRMTTREGVPVQLLEWLKPMALVGLGALTTAVLWLKRRFADSWPARWSVLCLLLVYFALLFLGFGGWLSGWPRLLVGSWIWALSAYLWYLAFALRDVNSPQRPPLWQQLGSCHPFFGGTWIHIGLGAAHQRQREVKSRSALAACQIKGLKLVVCCWLMFLLQKAMIDYREGLGLLPFTPLLHRHLGGLELYPRSVCWVSLLFTFFESVVGGYAVGNLLVACARMGGFQLLQQVYRPLSARSISDYWNRISYYYKQAVVELFFYPCFLRFGKGYPRLRTGLAIFMAAGIGNLLYHLRSLSPQMARLGLAESLWGMRTYVCYCLILSLGLWISMLSSSEQSKPPDPVRRFLILARIVLFYSVLSIFDELYTPDSPWRRFRFLGYLCGLGESML